MKSADGRFEYRDQQDDPLPPGSAPLDVHHVAFQCRRSNTSGWCSVNLRERGHDIPNRSWAWDGNVDKPMLEPSINCRDCWHGYIICGVFMKTDRKTPESKQ